MVDNLQLPSGAKDKRKFDSPPGNRKDELKYNRPENNASSMILRNSQDLTKPDPLDSSVASVNRLRLSTPSGKTKSSSMIMPNTLQFQSSKLKDKVA